MSPTSVLVVFAVLVAVIMILKTWRTHQQLERLRRTTPDRACLEVRLPAGTNDSALRMQRFWNKIAAACSSDPTLRRQGRGAIRMIYHAHIPPGHRTPLVSCYLYCDPDQLSSVERVLKGVFDGQAEVITPEDDPLRRWSEEFVAGLDAENTQFAREDA